MKPIYRFLFALFLGLALAQPQTASAQLGVAAGFNFEQLNDIELAQGQAAFDNRTGWHIAAWLDLPVGSTLALRPGVRYMDAGSLYRGLNENDGTFEDDFSVFFLEIPLDVRFRFGSSGALVPYIVGGPVLRFPLASDDQLNDDLRTVSIAGGLGVGVELPLGGLRLYPELAYTFDVSGFAEGDFHIGGRRFVTDDTQFLNGVMLRVGIGL
jgi:hypothetical protein